MRFYILTLLFLLTFSPAYTAPVDSANTGEMAAAIDEGLKDSLGQIAQDEHTKTQIAKEQYYRDSLIHRKNTFQWQYSSSKIIFYVVIFIVICGIMYSGIQFYQSMHEARTKERMAVNRAIQKLAAEPLPEFQDAKTNLELSMSGIKVSSSLIGILILLISIAFFYLYLAKVYPIDQMRIDTEKQRQDIEAAAAKTE